MSSNEPEDNAVMQSLKERICVDAEKIIKESLPSKVLSLSEIYAQSKVGENSTANYFVPDSELEKYALNKTQVIPVNPEIAKVTNILKREISEMLDDLNTLRLWIRLNTPRIEDGNNFGVEIQHEILSMIDSLYSSGLQFLKNMSAYFFKRAKYLSTMRKRPHIKDIYKAIQDLDEKQYINLSFSCCDLRNNFFFVYDKIKKNYDRLLKPKGTRSATNMMY
mmetsp:Transcript_4003/g.5836  ORF Transcript_4003/g.5836 Transcript_4003/m.5836 type:complete len:221 (+) Transcript_4003:565-1227(+)